MAALKHFRWKNQGECDDPNLQEQSLLHFTKMILGKFWGSGESPGPFDNPVIFINSHLRLKISRLRTTDSGFQSLQTYEHVRSFFIFLLQTSEHWSPKRCSLSVTLANYFGMNSKLHDSWNEIINWALWIEFIGLREFARFR